MADYVEWTHSIKDPKDLSCIKHHMIFYNKLNQTHNEPEKCGLLNIHTYLGRDLGSSFVERSEESLKGS